MPEVLITNFPQTVTADPFNVNVIIKGAKSGKNYLRIEIYKDGTDNYFGETFNGKDWYNGTDGTNYFPVEVKSASASAIIQARIGNSKEYLGSGTYTLKVKRYTASGNAANDVQASVAIQINYNLETPTPVATIEPTILMTSTIVPTILSVAPSAQILADETEVPIQTITTHKVLNKPAGFNFFAAGIFAIGLFCVGIAIYKVYNETNVSKRKKDF